MPLSVFIQPYPSTTRPCLAEHCSTVLGPNTLGRLFVCASLASMCFHHSRWTLASPGSESFSDLPIHAIRVVTGEGVGRRVVIDVLARRLVSALRQLLRQSSLTLSCVIRLVLCVKTLQCKHKLPSISAVQCAISAYIQIERSTNDGRKGSCGDSDRRRDTTLGCNTAYFSRRANKLAPSAVQ